MKIEGLRILDSNFYHQITICDGRIVVQRRDKKGNLISKDVGVKCVRSDNPVSKEIKELDDFEAIDRAVIYYLDYNKIIGVCDGLEIGNKKYVIIESPNDKRLRFRIMPSNVTVMRVMDRYRQDREEFLLNLVDNSCEFEFGIQLDQTNYDKGKDCLGRDKGIFCLLSKKDETGRVDVSGKELEFFGKAISLIMKDRIAMVYNHEEFDRFGFLMKDYIIIDPEHYEKQIRIPRELVPAAERFVSEHNQRVWDKRREQEKIEGKVYQMKMEEF